MPRKKGKGKNPMFPQGHQDHDNTASQDQQDPDDPDNSADHPFDEDLIPVGLEEIKLWSIGAMRVFLELRGKSVKGSTDELAAR